MTSPAIKQAIALKDRELARTLNALLEIDNHDNRARFRKVLAHPSFIPRYDISLSMDRQMALERLRHVTDNKLLSVLDFEQNPLNVFAAHEVAGMSDGSFATKMTVQFNLFGGTIIKLGSQRHRWLLEGIDTLSDIGCFALTELGYGNNAVEMETTAVYDHSSREIIINTPSTLAQKYWITNSAIHAKWAIVFCQLYVQGVNEGIHAILVRIRNEDMSVCEGVSIHDMGKKMECNGVDNGKLSFSHVRVPVANLLNKYSDISTDGKFSSSIPNKRQRFLKVADQLLSGRLCIASMCNGGAMTCLTMAFKFAESRLTVGRTGKSDMPIARYQLLQNAYMPLLARQYILHFGLQYARDRWAKVTDQDQAEVLRFCCVIKPLVTWNCERIGSICRERSGGQGYLACNRFASMVGFAHAGMTAEGDNAVLMQKVTKELLDAVQKGLYDIKVDAKPIAGKKLGEMSLPDLIVLLQIKEGRLVKRLTETISRKLMQENVSLFDVWMQQESALVQEVAKSFGETMCLNHLLKTVIPRAEVAAKEVLAKIGRLFVLDSIIKHSLSWYIEEKLLEDTSNLNEIYDSAVQQCWEHSRALVAAYNIPDDIIHSPAAADWVAFNDEDNKGEVLGSKI